MRGFWSSVAVAAVVIMNTGCSTIKDIATAKVYPRCGMFTTASIRGQVEDYAVASGPEVIEVSAEPDGNGGFKAKLAIDVIEALREKEEEEGLPWLGASLPAFIGDVLILGGGIYGTVETYRHYSSKGDDDEAPEDNRKTKVAFGDNVEIEHLEGDPDGSYQFGNNVKIGTFDVGSPKETATP